MLRINSEKRIVLNISIQEAKEKEKMRDNKVLQVISIIIAIVLFEGSGLVTYGLQLELS